MLNDRNHVLLIDCFQGQFPSIVLMRRTAVNTLAKGLAFRWNLPINASGEQMVAWRDSQHEQETPPASRLLTTSKAKSRPQSAGEYKADVVDLEDPDKRVPF